MSELGVRPLNARSLVLSVLLGLPRPWLPAEAPGRLAELFGITPGTMRMAISRMVASGEVSAVDGGYELHGRLLVRKAAQDVGRRPAGDRWDGTWWILTAVAPRRSLAARRELRMAMANGRMGELRPDTWLRPANLAGPEVVHGTVLLRGPLRGVSDSELAGRLWDLASIDRQCRKLRSAVDEGIDFLAEQSTAALRDGMMLAASVVRFLRAEPLLPRSLTPVSWPADELRERYRDFDRAFGRTLRAALSSPVERRDDLGALRRDS